jgi:DNA replication and repair protein RecF
MHIIQLNIENFRNYKQQTVTFSPHINVIYGENAQGKSNLLEAVFYFGSGKSFRAKRDADLIRFGEESASLCADVFSGGRGQRLEARFSNRPAVKRILTAGGVKLTSPRELLGRMPCVFFGPDELDIVRAGAAARRRFMDVALCQSRPRYLKALSEYARLYKHKTWLLRNNRPGSSMADTLSTFNERMSQAGAVLIHFRREFVDKITPSAVSLHADISGRRETLSLRYTTHRAILSEAPENCLAASLFALMEERAQAEWAAAHCLVGPHKDDIELYINENNLRLFGSQGQARTAALALKMAEQAIMREEMNDAPILLLDDVLSELDEHRQNFILHHLQGGQVLITCCEKERITTLKNGKNIHIHAGAWVEQEGS